MTLRDLRALYPRARIENDFGLPGETFGLVPGLNPSVQAVVRNGRIVSLRIYRYGHA